MPQQRKKCLSLDSRIGRVSVFTATYARCKRASSRSHTSVYEDRLRDSGFDFRYICYSLFLTKYRYRRDLVGTCICRITPRTECRTRIWHRGTRFWEIPEKPALERVPKLTSRCELSSSQPRSTPLEKTPRRHNLFCRFGHALRHRLGWGSSEGLCVTIRTRAMWAAYHQPSRSKFKLFEGRTSGSVFLAILKYCLTFSNGCLLAEQSISVCSI